MKGKILSAILTLVLIVTMLPLGALPMNAEEPTSTPRSVELGTGSITGWDETNGYHYIYYGDSKYFNVKYGDSNRTYKQQSGDPVGPIKWRVLDDQTNTGTDDGFFLLSEYLFGQAEFEGIYFNYFQGTKLDEHNLYQGSDAQDWCKGFGNTNFSTIEFAAVIETTKSDASYRSPAWPLTFLGVENILNKDKIFFPSAEEMETPTYGFPKGYSTSGKQDIPKNKTRMATDTEGISGGYLLRTRDGKTSYVGQVVNDWGYIWNISTASAAAARPAFNLSKTAVSFIESATGSQTVGKMTAVTDNATREWKLNLLDSSRNFAVSETALAATIGSKILVNYTGAETGTNEYISALLVDANGDVVYSGILSKAAASGNVDVAIPAELAAGTYTLKLFNEQANGDKMTDYVSNFADVTLTVKEPFAVIEGLEDTYYHTGLAIEPDMTVKAKADGRVLTEGTDYTVAYENNTDLGQASLKITYIGANAGEEPQATTFKIIPNPLPEGKTADDYVDYNKDWQNVDAVITAKDGYLISVDSYTDFKKTTVWSTAGESSIAFSIKDETDNGRIYDVVSVTVKVDKTAPIISMVRQMAMGVTQVRLVVQARDTQSEGLTYSFDGGETWITQAGTVVTKNGIYDVWVKDAAGNIAKTTSTVTGIDDIPPTGSIHFKDNTWDSFSSTVTFELSLKGSDKLMLSVQDTGNAGVKSAEYFLSETPYESAEAVLADGNITWQSVTLSGGAGEIAFDAEQKVIVYLKITDNANNITVINTSGLIIDSTVPAISGIENNKTYCGAVEVLVSDENLDKVTVGGNEVTVTDGKFTVSPASGVQTVIAYDKAGNSVTYEITVNDWHTLKYANGLYNYQISETCEFCEHFAVAVLRVDDHKTYDGDPIANAYVEYLGYEGAEWLGDRNLAVSFEVLVGDNYQPLAATPTDAGNYRASISFGGTTAYRLIEIVPAVVYIPAADEREFKYNGAPYTYNIETNSAYTIIGETTKTDAGEYVIELQLVSSNYVWFDTTTENKIYSFVIEKFEWKVPTLTDLTYTGELRKPIGIGGSDVPWTVEKNDGGINVDEYEVILKIKDPANNKWNTTDEATVTLTWRIVAAANEWTQVPAIQDWTYGENPNQPTAAAKFGSYIVFLYAKADSDLWSSDSPTEAGDYVMGVRVIESDNWGALLGFVDFTIHKATPTADLFTFALPANLNACDGLAKEAVVAIKDGVVGVGDITVKYFKGETELTSAPKTVGTYTVKIDVAEGSNYSAVEELTIGTFTFDIADEADHTGVTLKTNGNGTHDKVCTVCEKLIADDVTCTGTTSDDCEKGYKCACGGYFGTKEHDFTGAYHSDEDGHWHKCEDCSATDAKKPHEGTPSCTESASCEICQRPFGDALGHQYATIMQRDETMHWELCLNCGETTEKQPHNGEATCTARAQCSICGVEHGKIDADNHSKTGFVYAVNADGETHTKKRECCEAMVAANEAHSFGNDGKCVCGAEKPGPAVTVTVENGSVSGEDGTSVTVNENGTVTVVADEAPEGMTFKGWSVNGELVSTDETYTFHATEDITLEAVYEEETDTDVEESSSEKETETSESETMVGGEETDTDVSEVTTSHVEETTEEKETATDASSTDEGEQGRSSGGFPWWILILCILLLAGGGVALWWFVFGKKK